MFSLLPVNIYALKKKKVELLHRPFILSRGMATVKVLHLSIISTAVSNPSYDSVCCYTSASRHRQRVSFRSILQVQQSSSLESSSVRFCYLVHVHIRQHSVPDTHTLTHRASLFLSSFHWRLSLPCPLIKAICSPDPLHETSVLCTALFSV